mmetsp:Transcript_23162/g.38111  ORF Transcript_23162/g.38111 Transcript_23162/m.38111 type:complete len:322 (-) Transcript_23162:8-973(-)
MPNIDEPVKRTLEEIVKEVSDLQDNVKDAIKKNDEKDLVIENIKRELFNLYRIANEIRGRLKDVKHGDRDFFDTISGEKARKEAERLAQQRAAYPEDAADGSGSFFKQKSDELDPPADLSFSGDLQRGATITAAASIPEKMHLLPDSQSLHIEYEWLSYNRKTKDYEVKPADPTVAGPEEYMIKFDDMGEILALRAYLCLGSKRSKPALVTVGSIPVDPELEERITSVIRRGKFKTKDLKRKLGGSLVDVALSCRNHQFQVRQANNKDKYSYSKANIFKSDVADHEFVIVVENKRIELVAPSREDRDEIVMFWNRFKKFDH